MFCGRLQQRLFIESCSRGHVAASCFVYACVGAYVCVCAGGGLFSVLEGVIKGLKGFHGPRSLKHAANELSAGATCDAGCVCTMIYCGPFQFQVGRTRAIGSSRSGAIGNVAATALTTSRISLKLLGEEGSRLVALPGYAGGVSSSATS